MKHQIIYKRLNISYKYYTKLRNKYRFFAYITDILTLDYIFNLNQRLIDELFADLQEILQHKGLLQGLDLALFGNLTCFKSYNLEHIRNLAPAISRYQSHKWAITYHIGKNHVHI